MYSEYDRCILCPRKCGVNRNSGECGVCGETSALRIARAAAHMWEEPCISGKNGSGAVFFTGCNLKCVYCQNQILSRSKFGIEISADRLSEIFIELQEKGMHNVNLVTGDHFVPHIRDAVKKAKENGLIIPVVFNCGGYLTVDTLKALANTVDIYMPDFKYLDKSDALRYSAASDYGVYALNAIDEMVRQQPKVIFDDNGILKNGVIIRHLCLPGKITKSKQIIDMLYKRYGNKVLLSIMNQYTPLNSVKNYPEINRPVSKREYDDILRFCMDMGIENAYIQEGGTAEESFIPCFDGEGVL